MKLLYTFKHHLEMFPIYLKHFFQPLYSKERSTLPRFVWKDRDSVLEDFVFEIFVQFLESENPDWNMPIKFDSDCEQETRYNKEIALPRQIAYQDVYNYIKIERPTLFQDYVDRGYDMSVESIIYNLDTEYLKKIIDLRAGLWT